MNSISVAINAAYVAVNDGFSTFVQSATDPKVQAVVLRTLATLCIVSAVALATAGLSGRVSMAEGPEISAALIVIAYGFILGASNSIFQTFSDKLNEMALEVMRSSEHEARGL